MIPTLLGIMVANFIIIHAAPGGPIDYVMSRLQSNSSAGESEGGSCSG